MRLGKISILERKARGVIDPFQTAPNLAPPEREAAIYGPPPRLSITVFKRSVFQVEECATIGEFVVLVTDIGLAAEFDVDPIARIAFFPFDLRYDAVAIDGDAFRKLGSTKFCKRAIEVAEVGEIRNNFSGRSYSRPVDDERNPAAAF